MKRLKGWCLYCAGVCLWLTVAGRPAAALTTANPYLGTVTNRNLFQLAFPRPPAPDEPRQSPPLRDVKLSGITALPDVTRAIIRVVCAAKPPEPAREVSLLLTSGGRAELDVQVLDIDVPRGRVKIRNAGTLQTLDLAKDAPKPGAAPLPAVALPVPPPHAGVSAAPVAGTPSISGADQQAWLMALEREQHLARIAAGQMRAQDLPPYPPGEVTAAADQEAVESGGP